MRVIGSIGPEHEETLMDITAPQHFTIP